MAVDQGPGVAFRVLSSSHHFIDRLGAAVEPDQWRPLSMAGAGSAFTVLLAPLGPAYRAKVAPTVEVAVVSNARIGGYGSRD